LIVTSEPRELAEFCERSRRAGKTVGIHPTMGALHGGHRANIRQMATECDVASVSIFVNPLQFGPGEDFATYPRQIEADLAQAEEAGAHIVLAPGKTDMFPETPAVSVVAGRLGARLEGERRPGHFDGVATVVAKLLCLAGPCKAYFGEKDYQQLVVVRHLVRDISIPAEVVACPTVREPDGLALSSRNAYLLPHERQAATALYWALLAGKRAVEEASVRDAQEIRQAMRDVLEAREHVEPEYAEVVDASTLEPLEEVEGHVRLLVAARVGRARLIDNIGVTAQEATAQLATAQEAARPC